MQGCVIMSLKLTLPDKIVTLIISMVNMKKDPSRMKGPENLQLISDLTHIFLCVTRASHP
jgi:hypothetical protein